MLLEKEKAKRNMRSLAFKHNLKDMKIVNPGRVLEDSQLWGPDPVYPSVDGYQLLLTNLVKGLAGSCNKELENSQAEKRPASEALVSPVRRPHWISGTGPSSSGQELASCSFRGGWRGGRGGRGWRRGRWHRRGQ
jgi:hypothetical protein